MQKAMLFAEMRTLLLSAILYLLGVAIILFFRPKLMFHEDGRWREFGLGSNEKTVFPFWLFCILWAIVSYLITMLFIDEHRLPRGSSVKTPALEYSEPPDDLLMPLPLKTKNRAKAVEIEANMKPGYYVLDKRALKERGVPNYIYVGEEPSDTMLGEMEE